MKRARAAKLLLNTLGKRRYIAEDHRDKQIGDRGIVDPAVKVWRSQARVLECKRNEGVTLVGSQDLGIIPMRDL